MKIKLALLISIFSISLTFQDLPCLDLLKESEIPIITNSYVLRVLEKSTLSHDLTLVDDFKIILKYTQSPSESENIKKYEYYLTKDLLEYSCLIQLNLVVFPKLPHSNKKIENREENYFKKNNGARNLQAEELNCAVDLYYSVMFGMYLPTASNGTINSNGTEAKCNCLEDMINVNTKENTIFCGCPENKFMRSENIEGKTKIVCISLYECWEENKVIVDNNCVACVAGSTFDSSTKECVCDSGYWRANACLSKAITATTNGGLYDNDDLCAKKDIINYFPVDSSTQNFDLNILLSPNINLFVSSCNMIGNPKVTLYLNENEVKTNSEYNQSTCSRENKYIGYRASTSNLYTIKFECDTECHGDLIFLVELFDVHSYEYYGLKNRFESSILAILFKGYDYNPNFFNLNYGDKVIIYNLMHDDLNKSDLSIVLVTDNGTYTAVASVIVKEVNGIGEIKVPAKGNYYIYAVCYDKPCKAELYFTFLVSNTGKSYVYENNYEISFEITDTDTNNATVNTDNIGCESTNLSQYDHLLQNLKRGDFVEVQITTLIGEPHVSFYQNNNNLMIQPITDQYETKIYSNNVFYNSNYCLKFGCLGNSLNCKAFVRLEIKRSLTQYLGESYKIEDDVGFNTSINFEKEVVAGSFMYIELFPDNPLIDEVSISITGDYSFSSTNSSVSIISFLAMDSMNLNFNLQATSNAKYKYMIYTPPKINGISDSKCVSCNNYQLSLNNNCVETGLLLSYGGYENYQFAVFNSNNIDYYYGMFLTFDSIKKKGYCKSGFENVVDDTGYPGCTCLGYFEYLDQSCTPQCLTFDNNFIPMYNYLNLIKDENQYCLCNDFNQCYDIYDSNRCKYPSNLEGLVNNFDGRECTSICKDSNYCRDSYYSCISLYKNDIEVYYNDDYGGCLEIDCYSSYLNTTLILIENYGLERDNYTGRCICLVDTCYDYMSKSCIHGEEGKINNLDRNECTSVCTDQFYCYNEFNFTCQPMFENNIQIYTNSTVLEGACVLNSCHVTSLNIELYIKDYPFLTKDIYEDCICADSSKCYDISQNFACINGGPQQINNRDGKDCTSSCLNSDQCWDPSTYTCRDKYVDGIKEFTSLTDGGSCLINTCKIGGIKLELNPNLIRDSLGMCKCLDSNKCFDVIDNKCTTGNPTAINNKDGNKCSSICLDPSKCYLATDYSCVTLEQNDIKYVTKKPGGLCITEKCLVASTEIKEDLNKLQVNMSVMPKSTNVVVEFSDPNKILASVNFQRYYMQVFFTDSYGMKIFEDSASIKSIEGTKTYNNKASITVSETQINKYCIPVNYDAASMGKYCYFLAIVADDCNISLDKEIYSHFARRIINTDDNGQYFFTDEINIFKKDYSAEYCKWSSSCILSTRYNFSYKLCESFTLDCVELSSNFVIKKDDTVNIQLMFNDKSNNPVENSTFSITVLMTKLYDSQDEAIDLPERSITPSNPPLSYKNTLTVSFTLTTDSLFYDYADIMASKVRLVIIAKVNNQSLRRYLEIEVNKPEEIVPQINGLIFFSLDKKDVEEYHALISNGSKADSTEKLNSEVELKSQSKSKKKIYISIFVSLSVIMLIVAAIIIYFKLKKSSKNTLEQFDGTSEVHLKKSNAETQKKMTSPKYDAESNNI